MKQHVANFLRRCAQQYLRRKKPYLIGITGSVGKTSCRMIVAQTLEMLLPDLRIQTSSKNFNSDIGLPLAILGIETMSTYPIVVFRICLKALRKSVFGSVDVDVQVLEYGIDAPGDMDRLVSVAAPHISIFTAVDLVHAHQLMSREGIVTEKTKLLLAAKEIAFYSVQLKDDLKPYIQQIPVDVLSFALDERHADEADCSRGEFTLTERYGKPYASFEVRQGVDEVLSVTTNMLGKEEAGYISLSIELAMIVARKYQMSIDVERLDKPLEYALQPGRFTILPGKWGSVLVDSSYNAAPQSMRAVITNIIALRSQIYPTFDLVFCLGEMRELGEFTEAEHRALAHYVAPIVDELYLVGESMHQYFMDELEHIGFTMHRVHRFPSSELLGKQLVQELEHREHRSLIVFKGSQNTVFLEEAIKPLLKSPDDVHHLARQDRNRMTKKQQYFASVTSTEN